ncbi:endoflagellar biogenesis protein [Leptospira congkakensis]|uniref:Endoflagellar biogenesis protein n=1 Tax=Leptospira congkakensis TaxID=2484932 RepID=A0A4Z1A3T8_9LEPT|nr:flagellar biosynthetic protein FliO [Leptospira congkakensis]TGL88553.1 endoflagellar biogenesis protein [Leptospira congkakensis]TGL89139.1 endoflagellar biogenesis protein [Leptospira congkakensis]TGL97105.1 endoflagellar biogenesis protein [Leptospira congkakensis]
MYFCLALFFVVTPLFSQNADTKELDSILRQELGDSKSKPNSGSAPATNGSSNTDKATNNETPKVSEETNLIQERYAENADDSPSATWILLKILFVLAILVGAGYYLILQMQKSKSAKYPVKGFMKVLSSLSLSATQSVQIVEVGGRTLVLGVADGSVSLLTEVTAPEEKSQIQKMKEEADPYVPNFLETVLESLQSKAQRKIRINPSKMEGLEFDGAAEIQRKAKEGLERLRKHRELLEGGES